ncbi:MAG TPA: hypothetical protein VF454_01735, partial [Gemmatimonadales bacterium]
VLVALLISSCLALTAHALLASVLDGAEALRRAEPSQSTGALPRLWLLEACRTLEVGTEGTTGFQADPTSARFTARVLSPEGWVERQPVVINAEGGSATLALGGRTLTLVEGVDAVALDYLLEGSGDGGWVTGWSSPVSAPQAIRLRWSTGAVTDTLFCPIGARG